MTRALIQLSPRGKVIYQLLTLATLLLPIYTLAALIEALYQLPAFPLADLLPLSTIAATTAQLFKLVVLTGFVSAGLRMAGAALTTRSVRFLHRIWLASVVAALLLAPFDLSLLTDIALALVLLITLASTLTTSAPASIFLRVWQFGLLLIAISLIATHLTAPPLTDAAEAFRLHVACATAALSLYFWLMKRYSTLTLDWIHDGLRIVFVLVVVAGGIISLGHLRLPPLISLSAAPLVALAYMILASHGYRALSSRNENASLAPHWLALATLFWLFGGFFGALTIQPGISAAIRGTDLAAAQRWLSEWVLLAVVLASVNEGASSLRGDNRRVTGYIPLWLIAFGVALAGMLLICRGVAQIYLRDVAALRPSAELMLPLTLIYIACLLAVAAGGLSYALGFCLRLPRIHVIDD